MFLSDLLLIYIFLNKKQDKKPASTLQPLLFLCLYFVPRRKCSTIEIFADQFSSIQAIDRGDIFDEHNLFITHNSVLTIFQSSYPKSIILVVLPMLPNEELYYFQHWLSLK